MGKCRLQVVVGGSLLSGMLRALVRRQVFGLLHLYFTNCIFDLNIFVIVLCFMRPMLPVTTRPFLQHRRTSFVLGS